MNKSICLTCLLFLLICCGPKQADVERIIEDGVEVVLNHLEPYSMGRERSLSLEEVLIIDTENDETVKIGLTDITHIDVDSEGSIFIANQRAKEKCIYKFDRNGSFISAFGKKGQGPGEFQSLSLVVISSQDEIFVSGSTKVVVFSNTGQLIKEFHKDRDLRHIIPLDVDRYLGIKVQFNPDASQSIYAVLCSSELKEIKTLDSSKIDSPIRGTKVSIIYSGVYWAKSRHYIFTGNTDEYEIRVYDFNGKLLRRMRKEYKAIPVSEEDTRQHEERIQRMPPDIREKFFIPNANPPFRSIVAHDEEWLFVRTYEEPSEGSYVYDIFNSEGVFFGRTELEGLRVRCRGDRLYCLKEKESGFKELVAYKMIWQ